MCREQILERKRREYRDMVPNYYDIQAAERSAEDDTALRQVRDTLHMQSLCNVRRFLTPLLEADTAGSDPYHQGKLPLYLTALLHSITSSCSRRGCH